MHDITTGFADTGLTHEVLEDLLAGQRRKATGELTRLWSYYRNVRGVGGALAQSSGLAERLRSPLRGPGIDDRFAIVPSPVIENDIAWRIDALVDFLFGRPITIESRARDSATRERIESAVASMLDEAGGVRFLQDLALLGSVHGYVDVVVDASDAMSRRGGSAEAAARAIRLLPVEAPRAVPVLDPGDYRRLRAYVIATSQAGENARPVEVIELWSTKRRRVVRDGVMIADESNRLGVLPVVHVQNAAQPYAYAGLSDVEPLIPLQDELNTRLTDRAHRVTMQSFNMYLVKGIEQAGRVGVGPGQVWSTDNPDADIKAFGGDAASPSEDRHIAELREAMDKTSGVSPVVLGIVRERLGHLSSENAIRITLMGVLNKTARKRVAYGTAIERICGLALRALDLAGVLPTDERDRGVSIKWPDPLPIDETDRLRAALLKRELGIAASVVKSELGYDGRDATN